MHHVKTLEPGTVYQSGDRFYFTVLINGHSAKVGSAWTHAAALAGMYQELAKLRQTHKLENQK